MPLSALKLARILYEAGAPPGTYNVIPGSGETVGRALVESPGVDMITFTAALKWAGRFARPPD
jgi:acyl-CoA reductase-like NAD-dependent aldehyde dehydrogenase